MRIQAERRQQRQLQSQQGVNQLCVPDSAVPVNPGAQHRTEHRAAHIAQSQDDPQFLVVIARAVQENRRVCRHHAERHPESAGDDHIMKCDCADPLFHRVPRLKILCGGIISQKTQNNQEG